MLGVFSSSSRNPSAVAEMLETVDNELGELGALLPSDSPAELGDPPCTLEPGASLVFTWLASLEVTIGETDRGAS
jgi:hypothetical protein